LSDFRDLEKAVEDLSELLESPIEAENIPTLRQKVTDKTVCVAFFLFTTGTPRSTGFGLGLCAEA